MTPNDTEARPRIQRGVLSEYPEGEKEPPDHNQPGQQQVQVKKLPLPRSVVLERRTSFAHHPHPVLALHESSPLRSILPLLDLANSNPPPQRAFLERDQLGAEVASGHPVSLL
jgi:hypothetical protein